MNCFQFLKNEQTLYSIKLMLNSSMLATIGTEKMVMYIFILPLGLKTADKSADHGLPRVFWRLYSCWMLCDRFLAVASLPRSLWLDSSPSLNSYKDFCSPKEEWPAWNLSPTVACQIPLSTGILQARILECHALLQEIFLTQGQNSGLLHCRQILYSLSDQGSPSACQKQFKNPDKIYKNYVCVYVF